MTKSNGIKSLKQAAKLLNRHAPDGESLAYINPDEASLLRSHGGSGIKTLSTVPSYASIFGWDVPGTGDKDWSEVAGDVWDWGKGIYKDKPRRDNDGDIIYDEDGNPVIQQGRSIVGDTLSILAFLRAKKDKEGLNEHEMKIYNDLLGQTAGHEAEFDLSTAGGAELTAPLYSSNLSDVAAPKTIDFSGNTTPDLTLSAEGGRIGYDNGGIGQLMPRRGRVMYPGGYAGSIEGLGSKDFVDKRFSDEAKDLASSLYYPKTFEQSTIGEKYGVGQLKEGQEHTTESLDLANKMLDVKQERLLKLENFAKERGLSQDEFKKRLNYFIERHGAEHGIDIFASHLGVFDNWEGERTDYENMDPSAMSPNYLKRNKFYQPLPDMPVDYMAQGGRIGYENGGIEGLMPRLGYAGGNQVLPLLDLGGQEKDYREDGGFVPIGRKEKADDVPARLSKNEFVFTADAVKAAGGGDIDEGAQRMYNVMKNLEAGGQISQQSQGKR